MGFECGKKIHLLSTCCSFEKKNRLFTIFPDIISIFQVFSSSEELLCPFQDFFKNSRRWTNPEKVPVG